NRLMLLCGLACVIVAGPVSAADEKNGAQVPGTVAVFTLDSPITDRPPVEDPLFGSIGAESMRSFLLRLKKAGEDQDVAAVVLLLDSTALEISQIQEIHQTLAQIKESKPVYAHADAVMTGDYALLSGA